MKAKRISLMLSIIIGMTNIMPYIADASVYNGWEKSDGYWYYYKDGRAVTGWQNDNGTWYYLNDDKTMKTGWLNYNGSWYYFNADGSMAHDTTINGYALNSDGEWIQKAETSVKKYTFNEGLNKFCADSASVILSGQEKNRNSNYSPVSLFMALSVLSEGADNNTNTELMNALNISNPDNLCKDCQSLYKNITFNNDKGICSLADSIWVDNDNKNIDFNKDTLNKIQDDYNAGLFMCDLQGSDTPSEISKWISSHTNGKLGTDPQEFVIKNENEVMEIFNTIYFKDSWKNTFSAALTSDDDFNLSNNSKIKTKFMHNMIEAKIYKGNGYSSSSIDFAGGNKMMFILPDAGKSPYDILSSSAEISEAVNSLSNSGTTTEVNFSVPKFDFNTNMNINDYADKLGLSGLYRNDADFTKFSKTGQLCVSNIIQNATITVNEKGAEAAAYTKVSVTDTCALFNDNIIDFNLNRPFIFAITDKNNTPLFIGVINNPTLK